MPTPAEAVQSLLEVRQRIERLEIELEAAKAEKKQLEEITLPPLFLQHRVSKVKLLNGAEAARQKFAYARLAKEGPQRAALLAWMQQVGEGDAIKATLTAKWGKGEYEVAQKFHDILQQDGRAELELAEDIHWRTLERIVLEQVTRGKNPVPLAEIGATYGDRVVITRAPTEPSLVD